MHALGRVEQLTPSHRPEAHWLARSHNSAVARGGRHAPAAAQSPTSHAASLVHASPSSAVGWQVRLTHAVRYGHRRRWSQASPRGT